MVDQSTENRRDKRLKQKGKSAGSPPFRAYMWIGLPVTAIAASLKASAWVGWAWQV